MTFVRVRCALHCLVAIGKEFSDELDECRRKTELFHQINPLNQRPWRCQEKREIERDLLKLASYNIR